jgi:hypothetical protein
VKLDGDLARFVITMILFAAFTIAVFLIGVGFGMVTGCPSYSTVVMR